MFPPGHGGCDQRHRYTARRPREARGKKRYPIKDRGFSGPGARGRYQTVVGELRADHTTVAPQTTWSRKCIKCAEPGISLEHLHVPDLLAVEHNGGLPPRPCPLSVGKKYCPSCDYSTRQGLQSQQYYQRQRPGTHLDAVLSSGVQRDVDRRQAYHRRPLRAAGTGGLV